VLARYDPDMFDKRTSPIQLDLPPWVRAVIGCSIALVVYGAIYLAVRSVEQPATTDEVVEKAVRVPELDEELLASIHDAERKDRLLLEKEPLQHLLAKAIDIGPTVAAALEMPEEPVPVADVRADIDTWRLRWLWYEGKLTQLSEGRPGHPIEGYSIYEATVELPDGEHVMTAFSIPSRESLVVGDWVRAEGYLMKLRDQTYPVPLERVPMLVGRTLHPDYPDWPKVTELDPAILSQIYDDAFDPRSQASCTVEDDQCEALWHLGAYVRDTADTRSFADWRKIGVLDLGEVYDELVEGKVERGRPMRVFGTLIRRQTIAAPPNPANIKFWTAVLIEAHQFDSRVIPIWIPQRVRELPLRSQLEVRGFYYRWWSYRASDGNNYRVPLFIADDLHVFDLDTSATMNEASLWVGGAVLLLIALVVAGQIRASRTARRHSVDMDRRRRKRRQQSGAATATAE